jgi:Xaa-Pro aminopeptidase
MNPYADRRRRLIGKLAEEQVDGLLISNPINVTYLTGFSGDTSCMLLGGKHQLLVSDGRFTEQIAEECPGLAAHIRPSGQPLSVAVADVLGKLGFRSVGFESAHLSVLDFETYRDLAKTIDWKPGRDRVEKLRAVKEESEIAAIRDAIRIAEKAFTMFKAMLKPDDCEKDLSDAMEMYIRRAGGRCSSFPSIVAGGPRAALAHAPPTSRKVSDGGMLLVDWGASGRFYKSDLTRVLIPRNHSAFSGETPRAGEPNVDAKLAQVYTAVLNAQGQALRAIRACAKAQDVDAAARSAIAEAGFGSFFIHGLGHGIGLQVHEAPAVRANSNDVLAAGMIITVEPGIYLPGWGGIRIEDDVLVTQDGCEVLTSVPKDLPSAVMEF